MAKIVNIHAAKTNFSKLVDEAVAGAEITIAKGGRPLLKLVKIEDLERLELDGPPIRELGFAKHSIIVPDWDAYYAADAEIAAMFNTNKFEYLDEK